MRMQGKQNAMKQNGETEAAGKGQNAQIKRQKYKTPKSEMDNLVKIKPET